MTNFLRDDHAGLLHVGNDATGNQTACGHTAVAWTISDDAAALSSPTFLGDHPQPTPCPECLPQGIPPAEPPEEAAEMASALTMRPIMIDADGGVISGAAGWIGKATPTSLDPRAAALQADLDARDAAQAKREREQRVAELHDRHEEAVLARGGARGHNDVLANYAAWSDIVDRGVAAQERKYEQALLNGEIPAADPGIIAAAERRRKLRESQQAVAAMKREQEAAPVTQADLSKLQQGLTKVKAVVHAATGKVPR